MNLSDLDYYLPSSAIATSPQHPPRVLVSHRDFDREISFQECGDLFRAGDVLAINNTLVLHRKLIAKGGFDVLFLSPDLENFSGLTWKVLCRARELKVGDVLSFESGITGTLLSKGHPQTLLLSSPLENSYFEKHGVFPIPPYISEARNATATEKSQTDYSDEVWYQNPLGKIEGSLAAPTASLHFSSEDLQNFASRGVEIVPLTLHVGLGTFLPVKTERLEDHQMHLEEISIPISSINAIQKAKAEGRRVWALGTTAARSLESWARGDLTQKEEVFSGATDIFITPGFQFQIVDVLGTNFHQPKSTLLALMAAFAGLPRVRRAYAWAIENQFRFLSYGDFSVWFKD